MMYPDSVLSTEMIRTIRKDAAESEVQGMLSPEQLNLIHDQKWFFLFVPKEYGGLELSLPEAVKLEESIAHADGSVGWVVTLCAGAAMFPGYFSRQLADEVFDSSYVCIAGSGQANGAATTISDGFEINGTWPYASGAPHATHFTGNCFVNGSQQILSFIFKKDEITLHPNWKYLGLNATAGYSFSVSNLKLPENRAFTIDPRHARLSHPVYRYPFLQLAETTITANLSGMCLHFFDLAKHFLAKKQYSGVRAEGVNNKALQLISSGSEEMALLQERFYHALNVSWSSHVAASFISSSDLCAVSETSIQLACQARNLVNQLYPYCGLHAAKTGTPINQVWRDINTASQHSLLL